MKRIFIALVVLFICAIALSLLFPRGVFHSLLVRDPYTDTINSILNNLRTIEAAKAQWVTFHPGVKDANLSPQDLSPYLRTNFWKETVAGEIYLIHGIDEPPEAQMITQVQWIPKGAKLRFGPQGDVQVQTNTSPQQPNIVLASADEELSRVWSTPNISVQQRAAAVNQSFTNGTPVSVVVAALGTNYTCCFSSARVWLGPRPEPRNTWWLSYSFGEEAVTIHTSAGESEDPLTGTFSGAGYSMPVGKSTQMTNRIWIGPKEGAPNWNQPIHSKTNGTSSAAGSRR
jgi:hypothetical protein